MDALVVGEQDAAGRGLASARACHGRGRHQQGGRVPLQEEDAPVRGDRDGQDPGARVGVGVGVDVVTTRCGVVVFVR